MSRSISLLIPELIDIIEHLKKDWEKAGLNVKVTECFRTKDEQNAMYAKGRTEKGPKVTNAPYPRSPHNWGVAFDICRNEKGREYDDSDNFFKRAAEYAVRYGLTWGGSWTGFPDKPHFELKKYMPNSSTNYLISTYGTPENFLDAIENYNETNKDDLDMTKDELLSVDGTGDNPSEWAKSATEWAKENGIFLGDGNGNYGWQNPITREAVAVILKEIVSKIQNEE